MSQDPSDDRPSDISHLTGERPPGRHIISVGEVERPSYRKLLGWNKVAVVTRGKKEVRRVDPIKLRKSGRNPFAK